ncbi:MAG: NFACT family protein [Clostridiales bacterium]|nr:NFACT family protein [Clostridiales bacterium]
MPLDSITLQAVVSELAEKLTGAKIDKIHQPENYLMVLALRAATGNLKLLITAGASPRLNLTDARIENPASPPMFCMLMRKHLTGARIRKISQPGLERIVNIEMDTMDEMGDPAVKTLTAELFGRQPNLILQGSDGRIVDCLRRVDFEMSTERQVLPGMFYKLPVSPERADFRILKKDNIKALLEPFGAELLNEKHLISLFMGLSPLIARELIFRAENSLSQKQEALADEIVSLSELVNSGRVNPVLLQKADDGSPMDFTFMEILQYGAKVKEKYCSSFSSMLDEFYLEKENAARQKKRSQDLFRVVSTAQERLTKKLALQRDEFRSALDRENLRKYADLLMAGMHLVQKGMTKARVPDYYTKGEPEIEIPLDIKLSPQQNAQRYYKNYNRMKNAEAALRVQIEQTERELLYLDSVLDELSRAMTPQELIEIREELLNTGYLKDKGKLKGNKKSSSKSIKPYEYKSSDGFLILAGRNNLQNEELTLKTASKTDIWFHTQKIPGSHVILITNGIKPTERALSESAMIAAYHSKASSSAHVPVDYTEVKNVKKLPGGKCGMVTYKNFQTAMITPDPEIIEQLKQGSGE